MPIARWFLGLMAITAIIATNPADKVWAQQKSAQEPKQDRLAEWIMQKVVEKSLENEKIKRQHITYDKYQTTEDLTKRPPAEKKETFSIYGENGRPMEHRVEENGRPVREKSKSGDFDFTKILAEKYLPRMIFQKVGEEVINDRGYFIITFTPKAPADQLPDNGLYDRGINRSSGTVYIDMEKLYIWKLDSRIIEKFSAYFVGQAEDFQLYLEQEEKFGVVVPKQTVITIKYKFLWITTHERRISVYGNHRDLRNSAAQ